MRNHQFWLTIIIPVRVTKNGINLFYDTLKSLTKAEGIQNVQILIIDNHPLPSKPLQNLSKNFPKLYLSYRHMPQPGAAQARNYGVHFAQTPWIAFIDADETVPPYWLTAYQQALEQEGRNPSTVFFGPCYPVFEYRPLWLSPALEWLFGGITPSQEEPAQNPSRPLHQMFSGNMVISRELFLQQRGFSRLLPRGEDTDLAWRLTCQGIRGRFVSKAFVYHHIYPSRVRLSYLTRLQQDMEYFKVMLLLHHFYASPTLRSRLSLLRARIRRWYTKFKTTWKRPSLLFRQRLAESWVWLHGIRGAVKMLLWEYRKWIPQLQQEGLPRCVDFHTSTSG